MQRVVQTSGQGAGEERVLGSGCRGLGWCFKAPAWCAGVAAVALPLCVDERWGSWNLLAWNLLESLWILSVAGTIGA